MTSKSNIMTGLYIATLFCLVLLVFIITSCAQPPGEPVIYTYICGDGICSAEELGVCDIDCDTNLDAQPRIRTTEDVLEELRSRQRNYTALEGLEQGEDNLVVVNDKRIVIESFTSYLPETGFRVANRYNLLSLGENISDIMTVLTKYQLREVLRSGRLSSNTEAFGPRGAFYEQFIRLKQGKVVFGLEEDTDLVSTYLLFEEEQPILEYVIELQGGIFKFFEGEPINFLGHEYFIEEVTNNSMRFVGVSTPDILLFRNRHGVWINDKTIPNDILNVTFTHDTLRIILNAHDEIRILPGSGLRAHLHQPEVLLTNRLDLTYDGLTDAPIFEIKFDERKERYKLSFVTNKNISYTIPLVNLNPFRIGDDKYKLIFKEGSSKSDYLIGKRDYFIINNRKDFNGLTNIIRLIDVDEEEHLITLEDPAFEKFLLYYKGTPGANASADLIVDNVLHKVYVGENETISVDLDGDGGIGNDIVPIVTAGSGIIRINEVFSDGVEMSLITPSEMRENSNNDLEVSILINNDGLTINNNDLSMVKEKYSDNLVGMTDYGALFILKDSSDASEQVGEDLIILYPLFQRFADVIVKAYE